MTDSECCPPDSLRERKKLATRHALGVAALRLAVDRGLDNVLVEDIAAAAGVSARTFNNYFASKHQAICSGAMDRGRRVAAALASRPPGESLREAIASVVLEQHGNGDQAPDRDWAERVRLVFRSPALQGEYLRTQHAAQQALARAIADRMGADPKTDLYPAVMAGAVAAATQVAVERWLRADPPVALAPLIRSALRCLDGAWPDQAQPAAPDQAQPAAPDQAQPAAPDQAQPAANSVAPQDPPPRSCPVPASGPSPGRAA